MARNGSDLTLVSVGKGVHDALEAAEQLSADGIEVEVVDLRTLRPLDIDTVLASLELEPAAFLPLEGAALRDSPVDRCDRRQRTNAAEQVCNRLRSQTIA